MSDFEITVDGKEYQGEFIQFGFSYHINLVINDVQVRFEPDEERNFRAIVAPEHVNRVDRILLNKILNEVESILKP